MNRNRYSLAALGILAGALTAGCRQQPSETTAPTTGAPATAGKTIHILWAKWDPADDLQKLADGFTTESGIKVIVDQEPWSSYQDKVFTAFAAKDSTYDIIIGDSQWLGRGAMGGHYLELTDWMKTNLKMDTIAPLALTAYGEYPKDSKRYWALPAESDAIGFAYRKDLFEDPKEKAAFKAKYGYDLAPPKLWSQFKDIAQFFTRPDKRLSGAALFYSKEYDGVTMGAMQIMFCYGGSLGDPFTYQIQGILNSPVNVQALEFYKSLKPFTPKGSENYYFNESLRDFQQGSVAMAENWYAFMPGLLDPTKAKFAKQTGFFVSPAAKGPDGKERHYISLGGQGMSISAYSKYPDLAKQFMKWFSEDKSQLQWAKLGGAPTNTNVLKSPDFLSAMPFNTAFSESFPYLRDFWTVPEYADLLQASQNHLNAAIVGTEAPQAAMDAIAKEQQAVLKKAGYPKKEVPPTQPKAAG